MSGRATPVTGLPEPKKGIAPKNTRVVKTVSQEEAFLNLVNTIRPFSKMDGSQGKEWGKNGDAMNEDELFLYYMADTNVKPTFVRLVKAHRAEQNREKGRTGCDNIGPPTPFDSLKDELVDLFANSETQRETATSANKENQKRIADDKLRFDAHLKDAMQTGARTTDPTNIQNVP
jgi:hypothetical protein